MSSEMVIRNLNRGLKLRGITHAELARRVGVSAQSVGQTLKNTHKTKRGMSITTLYKYAKALDIPLNMLLTTDFEKLCDSDLRELINLTRYISNLPINKKRQTLSFGVTAMQNLNEAISTRPKKVKK